MVLTALLVLCIALLALSTSRQNPPSSAGALLAEEEQQPTRPPLLFLHIEKCGGTTICDYAQSNNLSVPLDNHNCNTDGEGMRALALGSQQEQAEWLADSGYDFVTNAIAMAADPIWDDSVFTFTILRHPMDRLYSRFYHSCQEDSDDVTMKCQDGSCNNFTQYLVHYPDNWMLRMACGVACFSLPKGALNDTHLQIGVQNLRRMQGLMILEYFNTSLQLMDVLTEGRLSVNNYMGASNVRNSTHGDPCHPLEYVPASDLDYLLHMNQLDLQLYDEALTIFSQLVRQNLPPKYWANKTFLDKKLACFGAQYPPSQVQFCAADSCGHMWGDGWLASPLGKPAEDHRCNVLGVYCNNTNCDCYSTNHGRLGPRLPPSECASADKQESDGKEQTHIFHHL